MYIPPYSMYAAGITYPEKQGLFWGNRNKVQQDSLAKEVTFETDIYAL